MKLLTSLALGCGRRFVAISGRRFRRWGGEKCPNLVETCLSLRSTFMGCSPSLGPKFFELNAHCKFAASTRWPGLLPSELAERSGLQTTTREASSHPNPCPTWRLFSCSPGAAPSPSAGRGPRACKAATQARLGPQQPGSCLSRLGVLKF